MSQGFSSKKLTLSLELNGEVWVREPKGGLRPDTEVILLLHGYGEDASKLWKPLENSIPKDAFVLAPNAPFPIQRRSGLGSLVYSWYFYDFSTDEYLIDMESALGYLARLLELGGFEDQPVSAIGFSQGGYLAPFLLERLPHPKRVIGLASRFLPEEMSASSAGRFEVYNVHGARDERVEVAGARESFEAMLARGHRGKFVEIADAGHELTSEMIRAVGDILSPSRNQ